MRLMVAMYCQARHGRAGGVCAECAGLADYAERRIERCPLQHDKPVCARCRVHCYRADMRARIVEVMRFAGPRMLLAHPWLALRHLQDSVRIPAARS